MLVRVCASLNHFATHKTDEGNGKQQGGTGQVQWEPQYILFLHGAVNIIHINIIKVVIVIMIHDWSKSINYRTRNKPGQ